MNRFFRVVLTVFFILIASGCTSEDDPTYLAKAVGEPLNPTILSELTNSGVSEIPSSENFELNEIRPVDKISNEVFAVCFNEKTTNGEMPQTEATTYCEEYLSK